MRKHVHSVNPRFVVDPKLQKVLTKFPGKDELDAPLSQYSIYQKGFRMVYCNPYPISASCQIGVSVVKDGMNALWTAVFDLITLGKSMDLNFGFARIGIINKDLRISFKKGLTCAVQDKEFEEKMKMSNTSCSSFWKTNYNAEWA
jgi:hypothetical protein